MNKMIPSKIEIREVGPRDGLQNESIFVPTEQKIEWINSLSDTGLSFIEATAFVHPKMIPSLQDAEEVMKGINRKDGVTYSALIPNLKGFNRAADLGVDEMAVFLSATESHNQRNLNSSIEESLSNIKQVAQEARAKQINMRAYISMVFGCPFEGDVPVEKVHGIVQELLEMGVQEVSLGDTIGIATPLQVMNHLEYLLNDVKPDQLALHFHDTYGRALANVWAGLNMGIYKYDSALGGLGGCPYAPGASGNVATEDLVDFCEKMGIATNVNQEKLRKAVVYSKDAMNIKTQSHLSQV